MKVRSSSAIALAAFILLGLCFAIFFINWGDAPGMQSFMVCEGFECRYVGATGPSSGILPGRGACETQNVEPPGNPFEGWPLEDSEHACQYYTVTSRFCDPRRLPWLHAGIDLSYPGIRGDEVIVTIKENLKTPWEDEVIVTQVGQTGWNYGMGTNVRVCEWQCSEELVPVDSTTCVDADQSGSLEPEECVVGTQFVVERSCENTNWCASYFHLITNSVSVNVGDLLVRGDSLGLIDTTGNSTGDHLHYELSDNTGRSYDPAPTMCGGGTWFLP